MRYSHFEKAISKPRLARYLAACLGNKNKAMTLYRANIRLAHALFSVLNVFEVTLRNEIDNLYKPSFAIKTGNTEWLLAQSSPTGFLASKGCQKSQRLVLDTIADLGPNYTHDKLVAELSFGFWRYLFAAKQFMAGGSILLAILPKRPHGTNHTGVYNKLSQINSLRNRIAHHEPVCFGAGDTISTQYALDRYDQIIELLTWMGYKAGDLLYGIDKVQKEIAFVSTI